MRSPRGSGQVTPSTSSSPPAPPGRRRGPPSPHRNIVNNAISCARTMRLEPGEALCIPVPLYHCFGMVLGNLAGRRLRGEHGVSGRGVRRRRDPRRARRGALQRSARGADDVRGHARPPGLRALRPLRDAHRDHGRGAVPGHPDAAGGAGHGLPRDHHRLRDDRDEPDLLPVERGRGSRAPRLDGRPDPAPRRGEDRRRSGPDDPGRGAGGAAYPAATR